MRQWKTYVADRKARNIQKYHETTFMIRALDCHERNLCRKVFVAIQLQIKKRLVMRTSYDLVERAVHRKIEKFYFKVIRNRYQRIKRR